MVDVIDIIKYGVVTVQSVTVGDVYTDEVQTSCRCSDCNFNRSIDVLMSVVVCFNCDISSCELARRGVRRGAAKASGNEESSACGRGNMVGLTTTVSSNLTLIIVVGLLRNDGRGLTYIVHRSSIDGSFSSYCCRLLLMLLRWRPGLSRPTVTEIRQHITLWGF